MSLTHILEAKPQNVIWGSIGGFKSPALTIQPGDSVLLHSISGEPGMNVPAAWIPDELTQLFESDVEKGPGAHILTGPIVIEGAQVGDTLAVTVDNIQVTAPFGFNYVGPMSGLRYFDYDDPEFTVMALDQEQQIAQFGKAKIPLHPFFGDHGGFSPRSLWTFDKCNSWTIWREHGQQTAHQWNDCLFSGIQGRCLFLRWRWAWRTRGRRN